MRQLEPSARKRIFELRRILEESLRDLAVGRVCFQRQICREHDRRVLDIRAMCIRYRSCGLSINWNPLDSACGASRHFPIKREQVGEVEHAPAGRRRCPSTFKTRGHRIFRVAFAALVVPAEALLFQCFTGRFNANALVWLVRAVALTEGVTTSDQRYCLGIVHCHTAESLANIVSSERRVWITVWPFRVYIDETHLNGSERIVELTLTAVSLISEHDFFRSPVNEVRLPIISSTTGKAKGFEAHVFHGNVACQDHEISPAYAGAVGFLHWP